MHPYHIPFEPAALPLAGFEAGPAADDGRVMPQLIRAAVKPGRYRLRVCVEATQDVPEALLFSNHRRLLWRGALHAGQTLEIAGACMVHPYLPQGKQPAVPDEHIELALAAPGASIRALSAEPAQLPALLLMGDSTVTDQIAACPYAPGATYAGWGQMLSAHLGDRACVGNFAYSGLTVETFREEGFYAALKSQLRPGDVALMQFGHNDQKRPHLTARGGYSQALVRFIAELRAMGATPVIVTPLARNSWQDEATYLDLLRDFANAARDVAREQGAPLIDLHAFMRAHIEHNGREGVKTLFHTGDYTHTNDFGAVLACGYVAGELARLGLAPVTACAPWPEHGPYDVPACDQGDESLPPVGLEALYHDYQTLRPGDALTRRQALELILRTCGLFAHNAPAAMPDDVAPGAPGEDDVRCAVQHDLLPESMRARFDGEAPVTAQEFAHVLRRAYGMRRPLSGLPPLPDGPITRAMAGALCSGIRI